MQAPHTGGQSRDDQGERQNKRKDADAFREALRAADFDSTRGAFAFGPNHHPIQTIYAREVVKEGDVFTNKIIGVALENHSDAYAGDCKM